MSEDPKFKIGWKFDHVWNVENFFEKFKDGNPCTPEISKPHVYVSLGSENPTPESPQASPGISSFSLNLDEDGDVTCRSERPMGVKKSKIKRKKDDQIASTVNAIDEGNKIFLERLKDHLLRDNIFWTIKAKVML